MNEQASSIAAFQPVADALPMRYAQFPQTMDLLQHVTASLARYPVMGLL